MLTIKSLVLSLVFTLALTASADSSPKRQKGYDAWLGAWLVQMQLNMKESTDPEAQKDFERLHKAFLRIQRYKEEPNYATGKFSEEDSKNPCVLSGQRVFGDDFFLECDKIVLKDGFIGVIPFGTIFYLHADEIIVEGNAKLDGRGKPGTEGAPGGNGKDWDTASWNDYLDSNKGCDAGTSAPNDRGGNGSIGGNGTDGAIIVFKTQPKKQQEEKGFDWDVKPGRGGQGGAAGLGANHVYRGHDSFFRKECLNGLCVHHCPDAKAGQAGMRGRLGAVIAIVITNPLDLDYVKPGIVPLY